MPHLRFLLPLSINVLNLHFRLFRVLHRVMHQNAAFPLRGVFRVLVHLLASRAGIPVGTTVEVEPGELALFAHRDDFLDGEDHAGDELVPGLVVVVQSEDETVRSDRPLDRNPHFLVPDALFIFLCYDFCFEGLTEERCLNVSVD